MDDVLAVGDELVVVSDVVLLVWRELEEVVSTVVVDVVLWVDELIVVVDALEERLL